MNLADSRGHDATTPTWSGTRAALTEHAAVLDALKEASGPDAEPALVALSRLQGLRRHLDETERRLIEAARDHGASWSQIAGGLGLAARQAAEQRWLRLGADSNRDPTRSRTVRQRQRAVDAPYGTHIADIRAAVVALEREVRGNSDWDTRFPRATLMRITLTLAVTAEPGALFALASLALADGDSASSELGAPATSALLTRLRGLLTARP